MRIHVMGHRNVAAQAEELKKELGVHVWSTSTGKIRALMESYRDDPTTAKPAPTSQYSWSTSVFQTSNGLNWPPGTLTIFVYETWGLRFAIGRAQFPDLVVAAWLWVGSLEAARSGMTSQNMSQALLNEAKEIMWPI